MDLTLKELGDIITIDAPLVGVYAYDDYDGDYSFCFDIRSDMGDLGTDLNALSEEDKKWLSHRVLWMGVEMRDNEPLLRIEITWEA